MEIGSSSEDWAEEEAEEVGGQRQQVEERQGSGLLDFMTGQDPH